MALFTIIGLCVLGGVAVTTAVTAGCYYATADDRAKAQVAENEANIKAYREMIQDFTDLKTKLNKANKHLKDGKSDFASGGHVDNGKPLANDEFNLCSNKVNSCISSINSFISDLESAIKKLDSENKDLRKKYNF